MTDKHKEERVEKGPDMSSGFATSHTSKEDVKREHEEHEAKLAEEAEAKAAEEKAPEKAE